MVTQTQENTLAKIRHLEALYRQGYHSEFISQSVDKILALETDSAQKELADLDHRLRGYEEQYQMTSEDFYQKFRSGELGDDIDFVEWSVFYEMRESVKQRLQILAANAP